MRRIRPPSSRQSAIKYRCGHRKGQCPTHVRSCCDDQLLVSEACSNVPGGRIHFIRNRIPQLNSRDKPDRIGDVVRVLEGTITVPTPNLVFEPTCVPRVINSIQSTAQGNLKPQIGFGLGALTTGNLQHTQPYQFVDKMVERAYHHHQFGAQQVGQVQGFVWSGGSEPGTGNPAPGHAEYLGETVQLQRARSVNPIILSASPEKRSIELARATE